MATVKEQVTQLVQQQPDDSSYDEIIRELAFHRMIERGLKDAEENRTISNEEMEARINTWLNKLDSRSRGLAARYLHLHRH
jgi:predicted transcriptional regulator